MNYFYTHNSRSRQSGFSTVEIAIAMAVLVVSFSVAILMVSSTQRITTDSQLYQTAFQTAQALTEGTMQSALVDFHSVTSASSGSGIYSYAVSVYDITPCRKDTLTTIIWLNDPTRPGRIDLANTVINQPEIVALNGDCGPLPPTTPWTALTCNQD